VALNPDYVPINIQEPGAWLYDIDPVSGLSRATYAGEIVGPTPAPGSHNQLLATTAYVDAAITASTVGVASFNSRTGAVTLTLADITGVGGAPQNSPTFAGTPNAPTQAPGTNSTLLATCQFVTQAVTAAAGVASFNGRQGAITLSLSDITTAGGAPLASPALTGAPTAPTAGFGTASGQLATTQFVANQIAGGAVVSWQGRTGGVTMTLSDITTAGGAPLNSPAFTGTPSVPTAAPGTSTVQAASTAFVTNAIVGATTGVASFNTRTGTVTLQLADVTGVGGAPLVSPAFTGTPTVPTATAGTTTTQAASTAFVANAIAATPGVTSFNSRLGAVTLQLADVTSIGGAPLASPALSGTPTGTTPPPGDNSTRLATTAYVLAAGLAPLASPGFTGVPTVPTAPTGTSTTQAASTAFVRTGTTTNDNAAVGQVGEFVTAARTTNLALATGVAANLTTISLTAGDWDVDGNVNLLFSVAGSVAVGSVSLTSGADAGAADGSGYGQINVNPASLTYVSLATGLMRVSIAATTTVYLTASGSFASGTCNAQGVIRARRAR
jgi:hypothetical protein